MESNNYKLIFKPEMEYQFTPEDIAAVANSAQVQLIQQIMDDVIAEIFPQFPKAK